MSLRTPAPSAAAPRYAIVLLACLLSAPVCAKDGAPTAPVEAPRERLFSLAEIRESLTTWRKSFRAVRLRSNTALVRATDEKPPETPGATSEGDWAWSASGGRRYFHVNRRGDGTAYAVSFEGTDGSTAFRAACNGRDPVSRIFEEARAVTLNRDAGRFRLSSTRSLAGLWWAQDGCWLPDLFETIGRVTLDGHEMIDGVACPRLRVTYWSPTTEVDIIFVVLDPRHRFLPRQVRGGIGIQPGELSRHVVTEFREAAPRVPFPSAGTYTFRTDTSGALALDETESSWKVAEVSLDDAVPADLFRPPIGPQTKVTDRTSTGEPSFGMLLAAGLAGVAVAVFMAIRSRRRGVSGR